MTRYLNRANELRRLKAGFDIVRRALLFAVSNEERIASNEQIDPIFFRINFALWSRRARL